MDAQTGSCEWRWNDTGWGAAYNPARWSHRLPFTKAATIETTITNLKALSAEEKNRPLILKSPAGMMNRTEVPFDNVDLAIAQLEVVLKGGSLDGSSPSAKEALAPFGSGPVTKNMQAIAQKVKGDVGVLEDMVLPTPSPGDKDLLVRVHASSINPTCSKQRTQDLPSTPFVLGRDGAGEVVAVGSSCTKFKVGDEVYFAGDRSRNGTNAEYTVVNEDICGRKPAKLTMAQAAAMPLVTLTAWEALFEIMKIENGGGKSILIIAGAGGVGSIAIQIAAHVLGLNVIATASRPETIAFCREKGARHVVNHRNSLKTEMEAIDCPKVDYVLNLADWGNSQLDQWAEVLKPLGHIVSILPPKTDLEAATLGKLFFLRGRLSMELMWVRTMTNTQPEIQGQILDKASKLFDSSTLKPTLTKTLPFTAAGLREGHTLSDKGEAIGKMCLARD